MQTCCTKPCVCVVCGIHDRKLLDCPYPFCNGHACSCSQLKHAVLNLLQIMLFTTNSGLPFTDENFAVSWTNFLEKTANGRFAQPFPATLVRTLFIEGYTGALGMDEDLWEGCATMMGNTVRVIPVPCGGVGRETGELGEYAGGRVGARGRQVWRLSGCFSHSNTVPLCASTLILTPSISLSLSHTHTHTHSHSHTRHAIQLLSPHDLPSSADFIYSCLDAAGQHVEASLCTGAEATQG